MADAHDVEGAEVELLAAERLTFFSDAVVAIAITLLALGLPVPWGATNAETLESVLDHGDDYVAFLISFGVIGSHWFAHHRTFRYVTRLTGPLARWNMLWLLTIIITPFATRVVTSTGAFEIRFIFYATVQALAGVFSLLMIREIARSGVLRAVAPADLIGTFYQRVYVLIGVFVVSIPVAFVTRWAFLCWLAIPPLLRLQNALTARRRSHRGLRQGFHRPSVFEFGA